jgi:hypothetical protein
MANNCRPGVVRCSSSQVAATQRTMTRNGKVSSARPPAAFVPNTTMRSVHQSGRSYSDTPPVANISPPKNRLYVPMVTTIDTMRNW